MAIRILKQKDFITTPWSGGTTTQLYILPKDSNFAKRDFKLRISSASVDVEESDFTSLPGFERKLMVLKGKLKIEHEGHHSIELKSLEQDHFKGSWITKSKGKVQDFNVIYKTKAEPILFSLDVLKGENVMIENLSETFVFLLKGRGELADNKFSKGEFAIIDQDLLVNYKATINSILIVVQLKNTI